MELTLYVLYAAATAVVLCSIYYYLKQTKDSMRIAVLVCSIKKALKIKGKEYWIKYIWSKKNCIHIIGQLPRWIHLAWLPHLRIHKYFTDNSSVSFQTTFSFILCQIFAINEENPCPVYRWVMTRESIFPHSNLMDTTLFLID